MISTDKDLDALLSRIHKKGYPAYKDIRGVYDFKDYRLDIAHVQGDPFASPSRVFIYVAAQKHAFPKEFYSTYERRLALCDHLLRLVARQISAADVSRSGSGKSGLIAVARPGQEVFERTACEISPASGQLTLRLSVGFPAHGRTIDALALKNMLFDQLPKILRSTLYASAIKPAPLKAALELADDQAAIRGQLPQLGLCAFVADGALLPRQSGISELPMRSAVPFDSPDSLRITLDLPHRGKLSGMGIRKGITVIAGGGYHGKSTMLKALENGIYNHIPGDGREYVITDSSAFKIRSEDGRSMKNVDISLFMNHLPSGTDTRHFSTENASGSTSQAGNVMEAIESGSHLLLIDEDTSATNFMIRDELMQHVIAREKEPITTFHERIRWLSENCGISVILVIGSSGVYFHTADTILQMDAYHALDITEKAKKAAQNYPAPDIAPDMKLPVLKRCFKSDSKLLHNDRLKLKSNGTDSVMLDRELVDVRYMEQLTDSQQTVFLGFALKYMELHLFDGKKSLSETADDLLIRIGQRGISAITDMNYVSSDMALCRKQEIMACVNRYRRL